MHSAQPTELHSSFSVGVCCLVKVIIPARYRPLLYISKKSRHIRFVPTD